MSAREDLLKRLEPARALWKQLLDLDRMEVAAVLTLGLLLLHAGTFWYLTVPLTVLCIAGFAMRSLLLSSGYWLAVSAVAAYANFHNWYTVDNHKFLLTYWCIGFYCSLLAREPNSSLALQGRWLVALCFAFAMYWKLASPDFVNSTFFRYELTADERFSWIARVFAGISPQNSHVNGLRLADLRAWDSTATSVALLGGARLALASRVMTWWTLAIEALVALAFLCPSRFSFSRLRHPLLIAFVVTTYAVANVVGFGWILIVLGLAQCPPDARRTRGMYYACFIVLHVFLIPFRNLGGQP